MPIHRIANLPPQPASPTPQAQCEHQGEAARRLQISALAAQSAPGCIGSLAWRPIAEPMHRLGVKPSCPITGMPLYAPGDQTTTRVCRFSAPSASRPPPAGLLKNPSRPPQPDQARTIAQEGQIADQAGLLTGRSLRAPGPRRWVW